MQRTLVLIKPDAVAKNVWLNIIKTYEKYDLEIGPIRIFSPMPSALVKQFYAEHEGKRFFNDLVLFMSQGTTIAMMIVGYNVIALVRAINGDTRPSEAVRGTIRREYGSDSDTPENAVHGSANSDDAEREIKLIFGNQYS